MKRFLSLLLLYIPHLLFAQTELMSLDEALRIALENNREILIADTRSESEKMDHKILYSSWLPQIRAISNLDYNYALPVQLVPAEFLGGKEGDFKSLRFGTEYVMNAGIEASVPL